MKQNPKIVCLGGGIGTVNLIKGLRRYTSNITVVVSMADDGGSAGRLRRLFSVPPPGDLISCLEALSDADPIFKKSLTYRFRGNRYGRDDSLGGHKLGNLILVALCQSLGDFNLALQKMEKFFFCQGRILPSTKDNLSIWAKTDKGQKVFGEENIDLGHFQGKIDKIFLDPPRPRVLPEVVERIISADAIIAGPGDLYTTVLPVLMVPKINKILRKVSCLKVFVINIANKPFETMHYKVSDYLKAINRHLDFNPFNYLLVNINIHQPIPVKYRRYQYVKLDKKKLKKYNLIIKTGDFVKRDLPLYHDSDKLAKAIMNILKGKRK